MTDLSGVVPVSMFSVTDVTMFQSAKSVMFRTAESWDSVAPRRFNGSNS